VGQTQQDPEDRRIPLRGLLGKLGGQLVELHYGFGEYDGFLIYEASDEVTATATVLAAIASGHVKAIQTTTLLTVEQAMAAMRKAGLMPRQHRSGTSVCGRPCPCKRGHARIRKALFRPSLASMRFNPLIRAFVD
jgi:transposase